MSLALYKRYKGIKYSAFILNGLYIAKTITNFTLEKTLKEEFKNDSWIIQKICNYHFNFSKKEKSIGLYKIRKVKSIRHNYYNDYLIFSNINVNILNEDETYKEKVFNVLLSDTNLLFANEYTHGYVGNIIKDAKTSKLDIDFDLDIISLTKIVGNNN